MNLRNVGMVIKYEIVSMVRKPSFWFFTIAFPVLILAFAFLPQLFVQRSVVEAQESLMAGLKGPAIPYVDLAGIVRQVPEDMRPMFRSFPDETAAKVALGSGEIGHYYLIPADFRQTGRVVSVAEHVSPMTAGVGEYQLDYVLRLNLGGNGPEALALAQPIDSYEERSLAPVTAEEAESPDESSEMTDFLIPFAVMFILFFVITMSSGYMLQSVAREKENRTAEILLTTLSPRELMLGKVVGLGIVALVQMGMWLGGGQLALLGGAVAVSALAGAALSLGFFVWALIFFLLGYVVYASALGALGAIAPTMREGSQFTFIMLIPLLIPLWLNSVFTNDPHGPVATALSLFPLSAPSAMMTRLAVGGVPAWQPFVALAGLLITAYLFVLLAARFFRADTLLSSSSLSWGRIAAEIRGK